MGDNVVEIKIVGTGISETGAQFEGLSEDAVEALNDIASSAGAAASALGDSAGEVDGYASSFVEAGDLLAEAGEKAKGAGEKAHESGIEWGELGEKVLEVAGELGLTISVLEGLKEAVSIDADIQKTQIAITSLTGSVAVANEVIEQMEKLAKDDAIAFPELLPAAQRMVAMGFALDDISPAMDAAANASWALGSSLESVTERMDGMALSGMAGGRQLKTVGLNSEALARVMGVTTAQMEEAFKGLTIDQRLEVLTIAMQKFAGAAQAQSAGMTGGWVEVKNAWHETFGEIGKDIEPLTAGLEKVAAWSGKAAANLLKMAFASPNDSISMAKLAEADNKEDDFGNPPSGAAIETPEQKLARIRAAAAAAAELNKGVLAKKRQDFITSYDERLADMKAFHEVSKEAELAFRQDELAAAKAKGPGFAPVVHQVNNQVGNLSQEVDKQHDAAMAKDAIDASRAQLAADEAVNEAATKMQEEGAKLDALNLRFAEANERYAARQTAAAKKNADAVIAIDKIEEEGKIRHAQAIEGIDDDAAQERLDRGEISKSEYLRIKQEEIDKAYQMEVEAIARERALLASSTTDPDKLASGNASLDNRGKAAGDKHDAATAKNKDEQYAADKAKIKGYLDEIDGDITRNLNKWVSGQESFGKAMTGVWKDLAKSAVTSIEQIIEKQLEQLAIQKIMKALGMDTSNGGQQSANNQKIAAGNAGLASSEAAMGAASIFAYTLAAGGDIPGALEQAAVALAIGETFAGAAAVSAEGGADLPNHNTLGFLHPREMVLPAAHADVIRSLAAGGRSSSSSSNVNVGSVNYKGAQMPEKHFAAMAKRIQRNSNK